jgi:hypothetical protein
MLHKTKGFGRVKMTKAKLSIFFGAGAESSYGLPSGGKFALDIFKMDTTEDKRLFRENRDAIGRRSSYAKYWLPENYWTKPISSFGKTHYESLVRGSLENKRTKILEYLNNFDANISNIVNDMEIGGVSINGAFESITEISVGEEVFTHVIRLSELLGNNNNIFGSDYFSAFLKVLEKQGIEPSFRKTVQKIVRALLELLIGACGEDLIHRLNDGIFEMSPETIDIFDDLGAIFSLDYKGTGMTGLEFIIDIEPININADSSPQEIIIELGRRVLEDVFSQSLDYQSLIDSNWRYLYNPKTDWAKFTKIAIFLYTVKRYIEQIAELHREQCVSGPGYYHDLLQLSEWYDIKAIGTTNYNTFIQEVTQKDVYFLNGSVNDLYDPYLNKIVNISEDDNSSNHLMVPFLFTQSGIKPLTSVKMSQRYVELYNEFKESDVICICGYGFNSDDGHINGMFRSLIEDEGKNIYILHFSKRGGENIETLKKQYQEKLRLESPRGINIIIVDKDRKSYLHGQSIWYSALIDEVSMGLQESLD